MKNFIIITSTCILGIGLSYYFSVRKDLPPVGIVIPHHDMVAPNRQAYLASISETYQPKTIILMSPDHYDQNLKPVITSNTSFSTTIGQIPSHIELIKKLKLPIQNAAFETEHGITSLLQELKQNFPNAQLVPVMISRKATYKNVSDFVNSLYKNCPDCFLIASVDFSHTNTALGAELHDVLSLRELSAANPITLYKNAEVDSPETLTALAQWGHLHNALRFNLFSHTNSGLLFDKSGGEITSHIIGGYDYGNAKHLFENTVTLMMGGDVMFAREVAQENNLQKSNTITEYVGERFFWGVDGSIINLEGVFTQNIQDIEKSWDDMPPVFRFDSGFVESLAKARVNSVILANNHTFDGGISDAEYTKTLLTDKNLQVVGYPRNDSSIKIFEQGYTKVALMAFPTHEKTNDISLQVQEYAKKGYVVITYIHWGQEYELTHSPAQQELAERLIDAGASLVVGTHPHVVQDISVYKGTPIVYSLGNFVFDQSASKHTQIGAVLGVTVNEEGIELFVIPLSNYINPTMLGENTHNQLVEKWTEPWKKYKTINKTFFFTFTK